MNLTPEQFISSLKEGKTEHELNRTHDLFVDPKEYKKLVSKQYGHTHASAVDHLTTDYTSGFTICSKCGTFADLGKGFTKHLSNGCVECEGEGKHMKHEVKASPLKYGGFPARTMCQAFDDGLHYTYSKLEKFKYKDAI